MQVSEAQKLSKESRAALSKALKEQLATVRKKVRHLRAKNLAGEKDSDGEEVSQDVNSKLADGKADRGPGEDRREVNRHDPAPVAEKSQTGGGEEKGSELKAEAEAFFQKGNRPKVGKTKSFFAQVMTSEQRSFSGQNGSKPKKPGGGRRK